MHGGRAARATERGQGMKLDTVADMLRLAMASAQPQGPGKQPRNQGYRVHIHTAPLNGKRPPGSGAQATLADSQPTLSYWCFSPGSAMQELAGLKVPLNPTATHQGRPHADMNKRRSRVTVMCD